MRPDGPRSRRDRHAFVRRDPIVRAQTSTRAEKLGGLAVLSPGDRNERLAENSDGARRERAEPDVSRRSVNVVVQHRDRVRPVRYTRNASPKIIRQKTKTFDVSNKRGRRVGDGVMTRDSKI